MKKLNIEDYLHSIDVSLKDKSKKDIYMIYVMIFSALFAFSYLLFWDTSLAQFEHNLQQIKNVQTKINRDEMYLKYNPPIVIAKIDKEIKDLEKMLVEYKDYNQYIKSKIETISFLLYDESIWGEYVNSVDTKARKSKVKIIEFHNKYNFTGDSFGHVLDIKVDTVGGYKNTLSFINALEKSELVVDIHDLNISAKDKLQSTINLSVWGIRY